MLKKNLEQSFFGKTPMFLVSADILNYGSGFSFLTFSLGVNCAIYCKISIFSYTHIAHKYS